MKTVFLAIALLLIQAVIAYPGEGDHHARRRHEAETKLPDRMEEKERIDRSIYHLNVFKKFFSEDFYKTRLAVDYDAMKRLSIALPPPMTVMPFIKSLRRVDEKVNPSSEPSVAEELRKMRESMDELTRQNENLQQQVRDLAQKGYYERIMNIVGDGVNMAALAKIIYELKKNYKPRVPFAPDSDEDDNQFAEIDGFTGVKEIFYNWIERDNTEFWQEYSVFVDKFAVTRAEQLYHMNMIMWMTPIGDRHYEWSEDDKLAYIQALIKAFKDSDRFTSAMYRLAAVNPKVPRGVVASALRIALANLDYSEPAHVPPELIGLPNSMVPYVASVDEWNHVLRKLDRDQFTSTLEDIMVPAKKLQRLVQHAYRNKVNSFEAGGRITTTKIDTRSIGSLFMSSGYTKTLLETTRNVPKIRVSYLKTDWTVSYGKNYQFMHTYPKGSLVAIVNENIHMVTWMGKVSDSNDEIIALKSRRTCPSSSYSDYSIDFQDTTAFDAFFDFITNAAFMLPGGPLFAGAIGAGHILLGKLFFNSENGLSELYKSIVGSMEQILERNRIYDMANAIEVWTQFAFVEMIDITGKIPKGSQTIPFLKSDSFNRLVMDRLIEATSPESSITMSMSAIVNEKKFEALPLYLSGVATMTSILVAANQFTMIRENNNPDVNFVSLLTSRLQTICRTLETLMPQIIDYRLNHISGIMTREKDVCRYVSGTRDVVCTYYDILTFADSYTSGIYPTAFGESNGNQKWMYDKNPGCGDDPNTPGRVRDEANRHRDDYVNQVRAKMNEVFDGKIRPIINRLKDVINTWASANPPDFPRDSLKVTRWTADQPISDEWKKASAVEYAYLNANEYGDSAFSERQLINVKSGKAPVVKVPKPFSNVVDERRIYRRFKYKSDTNSQFENRESKCVKSIFGQDEETFCDTGLE